MKEHGDDLFRYPNIRLNFSSNIWTHADLSDLEAHLCQHIDIIRHYPEPEPTSLEHLIAGKIHMSSDEIMVTNGITSAIHLIAKAYESRRHIVSVPSFSEYSHHEGQGCLRWICNPNNPTGMCVSSTELYPSDDENELFVIDQSYEDYTTATMLCDEDIVKHGRMILLHSMTKKYCIPGLRLGYLTAHRDIIAKLREFRTPWSVNSLAIEAGKYLVTHDINVLPSIDWMQKETEWFRESINQMEGLEAFPTQTNFFLVRLKHLNSSLLKENLATKEGILIRDASSFEGLDDHYIRLATQLHEENETLLTCLKQYL